MKNVSLKTIAAELGVSVNTVSHALRDMGDISKETKSRVRKKAIELGYMPNQIAQTLKGDELPVVAILISSFDNLYYNTLCNELTKLFQEKKEFNFMFIFSGDGADESDIVKQCILQRVDLLLTHRKLSQPTEELAKLNRIHLVTVGHPDAGEADCVTVDEEQGCAMAARYLASLPEGGDCLYIGVDYDLSHLRRDLFGNEIFALTGRHTASFEFWEEDLALLERYLEEGKRRLFFYCDSLAYQVIEELEKRLGGSLFARYPDLHPVGFDGLCNVISGFRPLTTVSIDFHELALAAYDTVKQRLENPHLPLQKKVVPVSLSANG